MKLPKFFYRFNGRDDMSHRLKCPNCNHELQNRFILVFKIKNIDGKKLPCSSCNYELIDSQKLVIWIVKSLIVFIPIAVILGHRDNGLLFIIPILLIAWIVLSLFIPLKPAVFRKNSNRF